MHPLYHFFLDRLKRSLLASAGLLLFSFGFYLQLAGNVGLSPWPALNQGLSNHLPITFGQASILVSVIIVVLDLLMKETIGLGTILDALLVGWGSDLFIALELIPYQDEFIPGLALLIIGLVAACVGQWLYMLAGLSCGPRDAFLVGLGKKLPKLSSGRSDWLRHHSLPDVHRHHHGSGIQNRPLRAPLRHPRGSAGDGAGVHQGLQRLIKGVINPYGTENQGSVPQDRD